MSSNNVASSTRKLAAILFADIAGYTAIMQKDENQASTILRRFQATLESEVQLHEGEVVNFYGDGALCIFNSPLGAIRCAINIQSEFQKEPIVPVRIGIHSGTVVYEGDKVFGDSVNVASRIESIGIPGAILVSKKIRDELKNHPDLLLPSLGIFEFKNVEEPIEVFALANQGFIVPRKDQMKGKLKNTTVWPTNKWKLAISGFLLTGLLIIAAYFLIPKMSSDQATDDSDAIKSIAVLAFVDMSPNKDQEYFSDGISEEILNLLSKIPELRVISRTSSFSFKNKEVTTSEIGKTLKVNHLLEGSIRKSDSTFRVTAQLINVEGGMHIWSETYDRSMNDIFKIQDEIAGEVTKQLQLNILGKEDTLKPPDPKAYTLYLQANHLVKQNTKKAYLDAEEKIKQSIAIDSSYAAAWQLLADVYHTGAYNFSIREYKEGFPLGLEAAYQAIKLDPNSADAYSTLSSLQKHEWNFAESARNIDKAIELNPNDAVTIGIASLMTYGDLEKAISLQKKAIQLDPVVYGNYFNLGFSNLRLNRLEEAEEAFETYALYYPNAQILHYMAALIRLAQGRNDEALIEIEQESHEFFSLHGKNLVFYALGKKKQADALFEEFIQKYSDSDPANTADLCAFRGEFDQSFYWLNKALEIKDPVLLEVLTYPSFKPMHSDPRWTQLINKIGFPKNHGFHVE